MGVAVLHVPNIGEKIRKERLAPVMQRISSRLVSSAQKKINGNVPPANAPLTAELKQGDNTLRDTGALMASISAHSGENWAAAGTNKRQAKVLQKGGTVTARKGELWIPACLEAKKLMKAAGATRAGELISALKADKWSCWRQGNIYLGRKPKSKTPLALFVIKKSVDIPARPFLYIDENDKKAVRRAIKNFLEEELKRK